MQPTEDRFDARIERASDPAQELSLPSREQRREVANTAQQEVVTFEAAAHLARGVLDAFGIERTAEAINALAAAMFHKVNVALWDKENLQEPPLEPVEEDLKIRATLYHAGYYAYDASRPLWRMLPRPEPAPESDEEVDAIRASRFLQAQKAIYERLYPLLWDEPAPPVESIPDADRG